MSSLLKLLGVVLVAAAVLVPVSASAQDSDEPKINVRLLLQPWIEATEDGAPSGDSWGTEMFLRRTRIILAGNVNKWIHFFYETDTPNYGKNGDYNTKLVTQDAYVDFQFYPEFKLAVGMILLPFTHHSRQSAASLNALDYHNFFTGKFIAGKETGWRDFGVEARGIVADRLDYRVGIYNGLRGAACTDPEAVNCQVLNSADMPRITGRIAVNLFDPEPDYFYGGIYLGKKKVVTLGAGVDMQQGATLDAKGNDKAYFAYSADLFVDYPLENDMEVVAQGAFVQYDRGYVPDPKTAGVFAPDLNSGSGFYAEAGFRYGMIEPVVGYESYSADEGNTNDRTAMLAGVNLFIKGHNANVKLQTGMLEEAGKEKNVVTLQTQLLF